MNKKNNKNKKKKTKLSSIEKRYCRCLIKVRSRKIQNPYGICTSSVYNKQNKKRTKIVKCGKNYKSKSKTKYKSKYK
jgi:hypothetical protein